MFNHRRILTINILFSYVVVSFHNNIMETYLVTLNGLLSITS